MSAGSPFSSRFASRSADGEPLDAILEEPEAFAAAAQAGDPGLAEAWEAAAEAVPAPAALVDPAMLALAVADADGQLVFADARFAALGDMDLPQTEIAAALRSGEVVRASADLGDSMLALAVAGPRAATAWPLAPEARAALVAQPRRVALMAVTPDETALRAATDALRLTRLEARVVTALAQGGKLPAAAQRAGVGYEAAREALGRAMRKAGVRRQAELVSRLTSLGLGLWESQADPNQVLRDMFDLTARQSRLALLIANGAERAQAGREVGVAEAVVKDELSVVFQVMDVTSAAELSRRVTETLAFAVLTAPSGATLIQHSDREEPLRLITRPGGGWIGVSDYGPEGAPPVFILHATATSRHVARSFVGALRKAGYRPLAIDRPGFGLTSLGEGDVFQAAAQDMLTVCDALKLGAVRIVGRSAMQAAWRFQVMAPDRVVRQVGLNANLAGVRRTAPGFLGALAQFVGNRATTMALARVFAAQAHNPERVERLLKQSVDTCPADLRVFNNPAEVEDYIRSCRFLASGALEGVVGELVTVADNVPLPGAVDSGLWRLIVAEQDTLFDAEPVLAGSLDLVPHAQVIRLPDAGRFPHLSHPDVVIAALA